MGIEGLLKLLDQLTLREHLSTFQGKRAAIDVMSWIYKGCYRCAFELNQNIESNNFLYYIFEMLDLLEYYGIKPICVFDGRYVGKKDETIDKRKKTKEENRQRGLEYLKIGNEEEARKYLSRCIIIDDRIITTTMRAFRGRKVDFMVAPYESDSQIAKLFHLGLVDFAISEDSDLVIYGIKVVMKLAQDGDCNYVDLSLWQPFDADSFFLKEFLKMDQTRRVEAAVLSGTDYNTSIKGIGIKKSVKHLASLGSMNAVIDHLREVKPFSERIP
jgi:exonuclease-1